MPPVIITSFKLSGISLILPEILEPNRYLKDVLPLPSAFSPTNGIVILVSPLQPLNADSPILVTPLGIVILVSELQPSNADIPILVTLFGIVILVSLLQPLNA